MSELRRRLPPLNTLLAFEAAARLGSFTAAGAELHLSQAAVSRQIRALESNLGSRLFQRQRYSVSLTPAGQRFLDTVEPWLRELAASADALRPRCQHSLTVYSDPALARSFLIPRLGRFARQHPGLEWHVVSSNQPIESYPHPLDVGLQTGHWPQQRFRVIEINDDEIFPVCAPHHPLTRQPGVDAATLGGAVLLHQANLMRPWLDWLGFLEHFGVRLQAAPGSMHFSNYPDLLEAAEQGYGIALGWGFSVADQLQHGTLVRLGELRRVLSPGLCAYLPTTATTTPLVTGFLDWLRDTCG